MVDSEPASPGLFASLRKLLETGVGILQNRVELVAAELQEEKEQAIDLAIWVTAALFFAILTVLLLTATIILMFPENLRVYAAGGLTFLYFLGALWSLFGLRARLKNRTIPFSATVEEIRRDREWLLK